jgi:hypothetical protein
MEAAMDEAADQVVEADISAMIKRTIARIIMQPLPRYGKPRFIDLIRRRMCMIIPPPNKLTNASTHRHLMKNAKCGNSVFLKDQKSSGSFVAT